MKRFNEFYSPTGGQFIEEGVADWVFTYQLIKRIGSPFKKWDAYKKGLIDDDGNLLRDITDEDRKTHWGYFDRMCWNLKKIIIKFTGKSQLSAALVTLYLLKEGIQEEYANNIVNKLFEDVSEDERNMISESELNANFKIIKKDLI